MTMVELGSAIGLALSTVREHKMRSFLTVLGVIIGTGTIIGVGSIIAGLDGAITEVLRSFGPSTAIIFKFPIGFTNVTAEEVRRKPLRYEDGMAIAQRCPSVQYVSPYLFPNAFTGGPQINLARYKGNELYQPQIGGTETSYSQGGSAEMKEGRFFTEAENEHHMPVIVVGEDVPRALMSGEDPIGKWVAVNGQKFEIVGVMKRGPAPPGQDDTRLLLPYFTMHKMFPQARENMLVVVAKPNLLPAAIDEARAVLRVQRRVPVEKPDDFFISTSEQMVEQFHSVTAMVALVMVVLSSIGLLVGGIGVMNIMLVSVTERTREIGVRKAIGARKRDILLQFTMEAITLTAMGGLLGVLLGAIITWTIPAIWSALPARMSVFWASFGFTAAAVEGLLFGIYPAWKAANLDPIESLRYE